VSNKQNKIDSLCDFLKKNHTGRENAALSKTLEAFFDLNGREVRKCVNTLRGGGFPVCSDMVGYYYAASQDEVNETIAQLNSRITKISNARNGLLAANCNTPSHIPISIEIKLSVG
jgi:hypothetical protein